MKSQPPASEEKRIIWAVAFVGSGLFLAIFGEVSAGGHSCPLIVNGQSPLACMFLSDWVNLALTIMGLALLAFGATILILDRKGITNGHGGRPRSAMKPRNLKVALTLIVLATPLLVISVNPIHQECFLTVDACTGSYTQEAASLFITYFSMGAALMAAAVLFLLHGREASTVSGLGEKESRAKNTG